MSILKTHSNRCQGNKSRNQQVGQCQTEKLPLSTGNRGQNEKPTDKMGENICDSTSPIPPKYICTTQQQTNK